MLLLCSRSHELKEEADFIGNPLSFEAETAHDQQNFIIRWTFMENKIK